MKSLIFLLGLLTAVSEGAMRRRAVNYVQGHPAPNYMPSGGSPGIQVASPVGHGGNHGQPHPPAYHRGGGSGGGNGHGVAQADPTHGGSADPSGGGNGGSNGGGSGGLLCGASRITAHTVVKGDTLGKLAHDFDTGICDIAKLNNIANPNLIILGANLQIPVGCTKPDNTTCGATPEVSPTEICVPGLPGSYTVKSGDTLNDISKDFNVTLPSLIAANKQIQNPDLIFPGQIINVPVCPNSQCESVGTYTIQTGDLYVDLAKTYHTRIGQIKALNGNVDPEKLQPGQMIVLPQGCKNVTTAVA